ncbi:MAG: hypothetical protein OXU78_04100 [Deltaproteobacteria bacterium]|nr:hypothetical protein [Deltaproteobacteria bacterium]
MERTEKTWILEIVVGAVVAALLAALLGLGGWTANKVVQNGEKIVELNGKIAAVDAKMDLLISGLNISVAPKESASAEPSGADRGGFQIGAGGTATE